MKGITYEVRGSTVYALEGGEEAGRVEVPEIELHWADGVYVRLAGIAGVWTREDLRGRGIASRMMEEAKRFAIEQGYSCSGVSTNIGNVARRLYSKAGYITLFRPGRFEKRLVATRERRTEGVEIRPYREGDEDVLMGLFEGLYARFFGWRRKTSERWHELRDELRRKDPNFLFVAQSDGEVRGWSGTFLQWVGLCSELYVLPSEARTSIARALLFSLEDHLISRGVEEACFWLSPEDEFSADLLTANGYKFKEQRVFKLCILDLQKLLGKLVPIFGRRLEKGPSWKGVIRLGTPVQEGFLRVDGGVEVEEGGKPDLEVLMPQEMMTKVISGVVDFWEAYLEGLATVRPMKPEVASLLEALFPRVPWHHPADDLW
ncbi:MAG: hypothetical protein DRQ08_05225 [Candidatus Latescibacterota bacterium]|nr:MAG: hypothetical protein DRQ08_05225 [Candidatus Latescibacterota bacterium]